LLNSKIKKEVVIKDQGVCSLSELIFCKKVIGRSLFELRRKSMKQMKKLVVLTTTVLALIALATVSYANCTFTIDKTADQSDLTLSIGQEFFVQYTITVDVAFGSVCGPTDYVQVYDDFGGGAVLLGTVYAYEMPYSFNVVRPIGPYEDCGTYYVDNTASLCTGATDCWRITVCVPCEQGCTLTPGYWKTHSAYGPAPYDDIWASTGEDATFFLSGQSYYEVLWTPPRRGNPYYILAHAYIAAELNQLNGASIPDDVLSAFDEATALFETYTPDQVGRPLRATFLSIAETLDDYNNGLIGPGHCSE
jgi:hypothetical protein